MLHRTLKSVCYGLLLCAGLAACSALPGHLSDPARPEPREIVAPPDAEGRQLYNMPHAMNANMMAELRQTIPRMTELDDVGMQRVMQAMGPSYTWYLSRPDLQRAHGVLVLAHGFREQGDRVFSRRLRPVAAETPTVLALGMSMTSSDHVQLALNRLESAGATDIVVIPAVSTRHNTMLRQWDYIFSRADQPAYATVPQVDTGARLHFAAPLDDDPLVGDILLDYAREISRVPAREEVIIVAHGPEGAADNAAQLAMLQRLADYVAARSAYAAVRVATLQDDASAAVRAANVARLRGLVTDAQAQGREVLLVTNLLGTRTVQARVRRDLRGLRYRFNRKGLVQHPNFIEWINRALAAGLTEFEATVREPDAGRMARPQPGQGRAAGVSCCSAAAISPAN